jgi:hypothetical protein
MQVSSGYNLPLDADDEEIVSIIRKAQRVSLDTITDGLAGRGLSRRDIVRKLAALKGDMRISAVRRVAQGARRVPSTAEPTWIICDRRTDDEKRATEFAGMAPIRPLDETLFRDRNIRAEGGAPS